jgi:hypothetical protein
VAYLVLILHQEGSFSRVAPSLYEYLGDLTRSLAILSQDCGFPQSLQTHFGTTPVYDMTDSVPILSKPLRRSLDLVVVLEAEAAALVVVVVQQK